MEDQEAESDADDAFVKQLVWEIQEEYKYKIPMCLTKWNPCKNCANCEFRCYLRLLIRLKFLKTPCSAAKMLSMVPVRITMHMPLTYEQFPGHAASRAYMRMEAADSATHGEETAKLSKILCDAFVYQHYEHALFYANKHREALCAFLGADDHKSAACRFMEKDGDRACMARVVRCFFG